MRTCVAALAVLVIAAGGQAADGKKKGITHGWPSKTYQYNPKEIGVDKNVPWQKDATSQKVKEPYRILGEKDMAVGTIRRIAPELGLVEIQTPKGVVAGYMYFKDVPPMGESKSEPGLKGSAAKKKSDLTLKKVADGPNRSKSGGRVQFKEFTIKKTTDVAAVPGTLAELEKLKGFTVLVTTAPNTPLIFQALTNNEVID